ncbi:MAG: transketolase [Thermoanaerobaculia bacterium]|nr:transketolase [Thermoanaerobaculia bacterium]MBP9824166.1 transketolase [Thermoanaerobaculia bacterium]
MPSTSLRETGAVDQLAINTLRFLAVDMVEKAKSGHPGAPLGQAPMAYLLWTRYLRHDPADPHWPNRDRFVLSCGHASALLYSLLHLAGYDLSVAELERFRQLDSKTPGHPEFGHTPGVETTTGPLGQGFATAVGMAVAREQLAARFAEGGKPLFDYRTWVLASDGDLMEGVASEAASLAGHLRLGSLKVLYDSNRISIDGSTDLAFTEQVDRRFAAYGWNVIEVVDGNDLAALGAAMAAAETESRRPTLIVVRTHIGFGSPNKQDSADSHGAPLGAEETRLTKAALGWPAEPAFLIPPEARASFAAAAGRGAAASRAWDERRVRFAASEPDLAAELERRSTRALPEAWEAALPRYTAADKALATRAVSGKVLQAIAPVLPELLGGSADLAESNNTLLAGEESFSSAAPAGRNLRFGVREHAMGAILSGLALTGLFRPYGGTFLIFSDYMRPSIRLAALMRQPVIYVFTHDSIFLGEDGPTHQPIDQLASLRAIPGLVVLRPSDACETVAAWQVAIERTDGPTVLALSRQKLPILPASAERAGAGVRRGGYVLYETPGGEPELLLIATGSEVSLAMAGLELLEAEGRRVRLVSLPSWELFAQQDAGYRESVLPAGIPTRLAVEAASPLGWERFVGLHGTILAMEGFGASAPAEDLARHFGFTPEVLAARARDLLSRAALSGA